METYRDWLAQFDGYARGNETKMEIIRKAAALFARQGYHGSSLRAIARSAGVDHSTLLHHFGSKEKLLIAVLTWRDLADPPELPDEVTPETVVAGMTARARMNSADPGLTQLFNLLSAEAGSPDHPAHRYMQQRHTMLLDLLTSTISAQRAAGKARDNGLSPEETAALIVGSWDGLQLYEALHPGTIDVAKLLGTILAEHLGVESPDQLGSGQDQPSSRPRKSSDGSPS